ncbi:MAG: hypothetical protein GY834_12545 [Bacteroidetes bacterium]|nr:hypothetical protein [Bacteroidota bacterium]
MSTNKQQNIEYKLQGIELLNSELNSPQKALPPDVVFNFDISIEQRFNVEQRLVFVICDISTFLLESPENKLGKVCSSCIFKVPELDKFVTDTKKVNLSKDFTLAINSVSISSTRGIMFSLFRGTILHGAILPLINPAQYKPTQKKK